ncbi:flagellar basal body-associated protein FliL [Shewanella sp. AS1]|uniref:flagellar basal body-associated protein FliL n=1 Tax=Shewanella sp. AS1 TaxID=2907626 RepID=UPI001F42725C|nr:flagellar basal body-associated protein FliL [Shewanella sp. AS1]MCE9680024.1 flagellar basal body-associated protein FliL [Shewanella sp. AS1]
MAVEPALLLEETKVAKSRKVLIIFIGIAFAVLSCIAVGLWFFLGNDADERKAARAATQAQDAKVNDSREAFYVGMPRPFLFNLPGADRSRLVEIRVQLMVRGSDDDVLIKKHIPLIEDSLLTTFSGANVQALSSLAGKDELRHLALLSVQNTLQSVTGRRVVEKVLFTGFVMQ